MYEFVGVRASPQPTETLLWSFGVSINSVIDMAIIKYCKYRVCSGPGFWGQRTTEPFPVEPV